MAAGKRYKFQGSQIQLLTGFDAESPSQAITGISKANPAVVTYSGADLVADGDVVTIFGVVGMTEVNSGVYMVDNVNAGAGTFELVGVNSTGYGAYTSGGNFDIGAFSDFCELTNYNRAGGTSPEISATTICSDAQEFEVGLPDFGTTSIDFNFAPQTAVQVALQGFYASGNVIAVKVTLPKSGGIRVLLGSVQQMSEQAGVGGLWTASVTIRNSGSPLDLAG